MHTDYKAQIRKIQANKKLSLIEQINLIKQSVNAGEYKQAIQSTPLYRHYLHQKPIFKKIEDIYHKEPFQFTNDYKKEFKWAVNTLEPFLADINNFLLQKEKFETAFFRNSLSECETILKAIQSDFGINLWTIEADLLLTERINGTEANWNKLSYYLENIPNVFYQFVINAHSKRIESKLAYEEYVTHIQNDVINTDSALTVRDFLLFKTLGPELSEYAYPNLEGVIYVSNIFTPIDQYLILMDVIVRNVASGSSQDKLIIPYLQVIQPLIINDKRITSLLNVLTIADENSKPVTTELTQCLNLYYSGEFTAAITNAKQNILKCIPDFEYYEVYVKCLINLKQDFEPIGTNNLINEILELLYNVLSFKRKRFGDRLKLKKYALLFMNTSFGKQIYSLLEEIEGTIGTNYTIATLSALSESPRLLRLLNFEHTVLNNFEFQLDNYSWKIYLYRLGKTSDLEEEIPKPSVQQIILKAQHLFEQKKFQSVIDLLGDNTEIDEINYHAERKGHLLFKAYIELNQLEHALTLFGKIFFDENIITSKIDYSLLYRRIANEPGVRCQSLIELPILYSLLVKEYPLYEAFDNFMDFHDLESIETHDIQQLGESYGKEIINYFLFHVATIDTMKYSTIFRSISEVEEKRIAILQYLTQSNKDSCLIYEKELNDIYRKNAVRKVLKEVDEGRLYIDVQSLKEMQVKKFKDQFKRFKEIESLSSTSSLTGFNASKVKTWDLHSDEITEENEVNKNAEFLAFKSLYLNSRENFLYSKEYGLDSCLSTRIRHGALKNHIRSVFEKLNLVTAKFDNVYTDNKIWQNQLREEPGLNYEVQSLLKNFSKRIDDYSLYVVNRLIQVQTEKSTGKDEGLFTYFTNDQLLSDFYTKNKELLPTLDVTLDLLLKSLINHTEIDVQRNIKNAFSSSIPQTYQAIIDELVVTLRSLSLPPTCDLIPNLIKSSTEIQNELEAISEWFYLNTTSPSSLLSIETVIDASVELTNKINPNFRLKPEVQLNCPPFAVYSNLVFIFNILFNNIIEHSHLPLEELKTSIRVDVEDEKYVIITVMNNVSPSFNYRENIEKLEKIKLNWNNHEDIEKSNKEGESGFDKIKRILLYELYAKTEHFNFIFENDTISIALYFPYSKLNSNE